MNEMNVLPVTEHTAPAETAPEKPHFLRVDTIFAWASVVLGYLFIRSFPLRTMGTFLWFIILFAVTLITLYRRGMKEKRTAWVLTAAAMMTSLIFLFSDSFDLHASAFLVTGVLFALMITFGTGNAVEPGSGDHLTADLIRALLILPLSSIGKLFPALNESQAGKNRKIIPKLLLGLILAVVPTAIVLLLLSYDDQFRTLLDRIASNGGSKVLSHLFSLIAGIPAAMYLFGLYYAASERKCGDMLSAEQCGNVKNAVRVLSPLTTAAALAPVLFLYAVFFFSQWEYYTSGFSGTLPADVLRYSAYAREGFFELCMVSAVNAFLFWAMSVFTARREGKVHPATKIFSLLLALSSLILIATAVSKLVLYIRHFDLTVTRVYALWGEIVLAVLFLLVIVHQFVPGMKLIPVLLSVWLVLFGALGLCNVEGIVADFNVDRFLDDGDGAKILDTDSLMEMGDAAVPALVRLAKSGFYGETHAQAELDEYLKLFRGKRDFWDITVPYLRAQAALDDYFGEE